MSSIWRRRRREWPGFFFRNDDAVAGLIASLLAIAIYQATKNPEAFAVRVFDQANIYQRLNRSTNEYCVLAVRVSSSLSSAEL